MCLQFGNAAATTTSLNTRADATLPLPAEPAQRSRVALFAATFRQLTGLFLPGPLLLFTLKARDSDSGAVPWVTMTAMVVSSNLVLWSLLYLVADLASSLPLYGLGPPCISAAAALLVAASSLGSALLAPLAGKLANRLPSARVHQAGVLASLASSQALPWVPQSAGWPGASPSSAALQAPRSTPWRWSTSASASKPAPLAA